MNGSTSVDPLPVPAYLRRPSPLSPTSSSNSTNPPAKDPTADAADYSPSLSPLSDSDELFLSPPDVSLYSGGSRSLAGIALRSFCLGAAVVLGLLLGVSLAALPSLGLVSVSVSVETASLLAPLWRLPFFLLALATFHFLEFWSTAAYNTPAATIESFLLTANWPAYAVAHSAGSLECLLRYTLLRNVHGWQAWIPIPFLAPTLLSLGFVLTAVGQTVRTVAMVQAGRSFNHTIQQRRQQSHVLVTSGIYAHFRHPSYFGFFWWAIGTQLVLGNVVCLAGYTLVLWRFFSMRIRHEETLLVRFFGDAYVDYRKRVGTKIPFV